MSEVLRSTVLWTARALGLFALARRVTRRRLRILCYHGASLTDEHDFRPGLFMSQRTFADRMAQLARSPLRVISLETAVSELEVGRVPVDAVVITIDDGWYGTAAIMGPELSARGFPATLYASTYYVAKQTQVFNVATDYALWKRRIDLLDLTGLSPGLTGRFDLADPRQRQQASEAITEHGNRLDGAAARQTLLARLFDTLGIPFADVARGRVLAYMNKAEARSLAADGVDLQLHTHRHDFQFDDFDSARREIEDNRAALRDLGQPQAEHFCYPSGYHRTDQIEWLQILGIRSATTVEPGLVSSRSHLLQLPRILDSQAMSALEFEAELSGFSELLRQIRRLLKS